MNRPIWDDPESVCASSDQHILLDAFAKLRRATISFVVSTSARLFVCLSVRISQLGFHRTGFHEIWYSSIFRKNVENIQVSLKSDKNNMYCTCGPTYIFITSRSVLLRMINVSDKICRESQSTHFVFSNFFSKFVPLQNNVDKYCGAGQITHDNMTHEHCMLDTKGYKHAHRICNTYCFSTVTLVARTPLYVMLYVHCSLSFLNFTWPMLFTGRGLGSIPGQYKLLRMNWSWRYSYSYRESNPYSRIFQSVA